MPIGRNQIRMNDSLKMKIKTKEKKHCCILLEWNEDTEKQGKQVLKNCRPGDKTDKQGARGGISRLTWAEPPKDSYPFFGQFHYSMNFMVFVRILLFSPATLLQVHLLQSPLYLIADLF